MGSGWDARGSWAEGWVWLSAGKAPSDAVTAGWGLGGLVPREALPKVTQPWVLNQWEISWLLHVCVGSYVPGPSRIPCFRRQVR